MKPNEHLLPPNTLTLTDMAGIKLVSESYSHLGEDYILSHITSNDPRLRENIAARFDGLTVIICMKGTIRITIDVDEVTVQSNSLCFIAPDSVFRPSSWDSDTIDVYTLFLSNRFIRDIAIDLNAINVNIFAAKTPLLKLKEAQMKVLVRYFDLLHINATSSSNYQRQIARNLVSAAGYQLIAYGEEAAEASDNETTHSRKLTYARNFLSLVRANHRTQRSIGFYADKMFISAKYLSLVIKETTGRSAAEWIDYYVLQEAKNLLRYSGKNIQQIAYEMNFVNQSAFGKFFKNLTGMSPTKFQNT